MATTKEKGSTIGFTTMQLCGWKENELMPVIISI